MHNLAKIYLLAGEYDKAYQHIWLLLLRGGQQKINLLLLGEYYYRVGSYPEAEQSLASYLEEFPGDTNASYLLGRTCFKMGSYDQAREYYARAAMEASPKPELLYSIACLESMAGNPDKSNTALTSAFGKGLSYKALHEDEQCLAWLQKDPGLHQIILRSVGN
jgi:tetratricopeptide (TPR) repeat protein